MDLRIIQLLANKKYKPKLDKIIDDKDVISNWSAKSSGDHQSFYFLINSDFSQEFLDKLSELTEDDKLSRIIITDAVTSLPKDYLDKKHENEQNKPSYFRKVSREELKEDVSGGGSLSADFLSLVFLSAIVATIGMMSGNIAIVIGAMVIAPLLAPNIALGVGSALGDLKLMRNSVITGVVGVSLSILVAYVTAHLIPLEKYNDVMKMISHVSYSSFALALCAGLAATIYALQGKSSGLVGVMVAVALLPPAVDTGISLAEGFYELAKRSAMVLAVNIVCFNLAVKLLLLAAGITPRKSDKAEKEIAKKAMFIYILFWLISIAFLVYGIDYLDLLKELKSQ